MRKKIQPQIKKATYLALLFGMVMVSGSKCGSSSNGGGSTNGNNDSSGEVAKIGEFLEKWVEKHPNPPKWDNVGDPDIDKLGDTVVNGLSVAQWERLTALNKSAKESGGSDKTKIGHYQSILLTVGDREDHAMKEKGSDLTKEEKDSIISEILQEASPEQKKNYFEIADAMEQELNAYSEWSASIVVRLPELINAGKALKDKAKQGDFLTRAKLAKAVVNILEAISEIQAANKPIKWIKDSHARVKLQDDKTKQDN